MRASRYGNCCRGRVRRWFVNLILAGFIAGSVYDIMTDQEHWPFSQYPMFSGTWTSPTFTWLRVVAVDGGGREFWLDENQYITPFDQSRLPKALRQIAQRPDAQRQLKTALTDILARYEALRASQEHDGPAATGLRLYEMEWTIDRAAANVDNPDRKTLVAEVHHE
jgi:hypothetical protein